MSYKKTKIIASIGPASSSKKVLKSFMQKGVDVFRLNFSHSNLAEQQSRIDTIRAVGAGLGTLPCIMGDLQGPKIRVGEVKGEIILKKGSKVTLTTKKQISTSSTISVSYEKLLKEIKKGQEIFINDGKVHLKVLVIEESSALCKVVKGGVITSRKGVNIPNANLSIPALTKKDIKDLKLIIKNHLPIVALSFVRDSKDVVKLKKIIAESGKDIKVIAKIETPEAVQNIDPILKECDGVMVARGDLGIEVSLEKVTIIQKDIITKANKMAKIVIVATEMLESMIENPRPTRAEAADVTNAILDGADAVMLSGETSIGKYVGDAVSVMAKIAVSTESSSYYPESFIDHTHDDKTFSHSTAEAAAHASKDQGDAPVVVFTMSGRSAEFLSNIRTKGRIFAFSPNESTVAFASILWNTTGSYLPFERDTSKLSKKAEEILLSKGLVKKGEVVVTVFGRNPIKGVTDSIKIKRVGEE